MPQDQSSAQQLPLHDDAKCREKFNPKEVQFLKDLGKFVTSYPEKNATQRFRLLVCPLHFADDCCWVLDEFGQLVCVPCTDGFRFTHQPERSQTV